MQLNEIGWIANTLWLKIPNQFPFIQLGKFVIMPNHIHVLLNVETQFIASEISENQNQSDAMNFGPDAINCVSTAGGFAGNKNPLLNHNISRVIRWYKGSCTFEYVNFMPIFHGKHAFMIILFETNNH
jgi:putative transposase